MAGESVQEIMSGFRKTTGLEKQAALADEIRTLLAQHAGRLDAEFEAAFLPQVLPAEFSSSARQFLLDVAANLSLSGSDGRSA